MAEKVEGNRITGKEWLIVFLLIIFLSPITFALESYQFERLWPTLLNPTYFNQPHGIAVDYRDFVYVADTENHCIRKFTPDGFFMAKWGNHGAEFGQFDSPRNVAVDAYGFVYVADTGNHRIQKFTSTGAFVTTWGKEGSGDGEFKSPSDVAIDSSGNIFVADTGNNRIQKFVTKNDDGEDEFKLAWSNSDSFIEPRALAITPWDEVIIVSSNGNQALCKIDSKGDLSNWRVNSEFSEPASVATDRLGYVYVLDKNNRVQKFDSNGESVNIGTDGLEIIPSDSLPDCGDDLFCGDPVSYFRNPMGLAVNSRGAIFIADTGNHRIQKFTKDGHFVDAWQSYRRSQSITTSDLHSPQGVAIDPNNDVYIADTANHRIVKFDAEGRYLNDWGSQMTEEGKFNLPYDVAITSSGDTLYVADTGNHRIQKLDLISGVWTIFKEVETPRGIAVSADGSVYVAGNGKVTKFNSDDGIPFEWDEFNSPSDISIDSEGRVYVVDTGKNQIFMLSQGSNFFEPIEIGDESYTPMGIAFDKSGNLFIADKGKHRILKFNTQEESGELMAFFGYSGSEPGEFNQPADIGVDVHGKLYVVDSGNHRIQVFKQGLDTDPKMKAIIAAGRRDLEDDLWPATRLCADLAYRTLRQQGFAPSSIRFLTPESDLDYAGNQDAETIGITEDNLEWALTQWAADAERIVLYMVDHGGVGTFHMSSGVTLNQVSLNKWLNTLQENKAAQETIVVYDTCHSGSVLKNIEPLNGELRLILASSQSDQESHFVNNGLISFSSYFWSHIFKGHSVQTAFDHANDAMSALFDNQNALLDENGIIAQNTFIGIGAIKENSPPVIKSISQPQTKSDCGSAEIVANVTDDDEIVRVWGVYQPLDCDNGFETTDINSTEVRMMAMIPTPTPTPPPGQGCVTRPFDSSIIEMPFFEMTPDETMPGQYKGELDDFNEDTTYRVAVFATDSQGNTSEPVITTISVENCRLRRAIIVVGGEADNPHRDGIANMAKLSCEALAYQGYSTEAVRLFSPFDIPDTDYSNALPTVATIQNAVESWAAQHTKDLLIYMVGLNAEQGAFPIANGQKIEAEILNQWIDTLQEKMPGLVIAVQDFCYSGSFIPQLAPPENRQRVIISSTSADCCSLMGPYGDISFSGYFWRQVIRGATLWDAFNYARNVVEYVTDILEGCEIHPILNDDDNGTGNEKMDKALARTYIIGTGIIQTDENPNIENVCLSDPEVIPPPASCESEQMLTNCATSIRIEADNVTSTSDIASVRATIFPPGTESFDIAQDGLITIELTYNAITDRYEGEFKDFTKDGVWAISVSAIDIEGHISPPKLIFIRQESEMCTDAKWILKIFTHAEVDKDALLDDADLNAGKCGEFVVWEKPLNDYVQHETGPRGVAGENTSVSVKTGINANGELYVCSYGDDLAEQLMLLTNNLDYSNYLTFEGGRLNQTIYNEPKDNYIVNNIKQNALGYIAFSEYKMLYTDGYVQKGPLNGHDLYNCTHALKNGLGSKIIVIRSNLYNMQADYDEYPEDRRPIDERRNALWSPIAKIPDQEINLARSFELAYSNCSHSSCFIQTSTDNRMYGIVTIAGLDNPPDYTANGEYTHYNDWDVTWSRTYDQENQTYTITNFNSARSLLYLKNQYPSSVDMLGYTYWSSFDLQFKLAAIGDDITTFNIQESPSPGDDNNPEPFKLIIWPGWNLAPAVELKDAVMAMQVLVGKPLTESVEIVDVNGNDQLDMAEVLFILEYLADLR